MTLVWGELEQRHGLPDIYPCQRKDEVLGQDSNDLIRLTFDV